MTAPADDYDAPDACLRCAGLDFAPANCPPCLAEVATVRAQMRDEIEVTVTRGGMNRADVRLLPVTFDGRWS